MSEPRVIKKYPNRRLYDTAESRYITLAEIRQLVLERIDFVVVDKKSGQDITRTILLQVIAEQEQHADPVMSRDFLAQVIRSYGGAMQGIVGSYLDQSMKLFTAQQREIRDRVKTVVGVDPVDVVTEVAQRNYQRWRTVQDEIFRRIVDVTGVNIPGRERGERDAPEPKPEARPDSKPGSGGTSR
jgi:polyhydroxyalkanoate synthesis repressor PhaR